MTALVFTCLAIHAKEAESIADSVDISLLTCSPGDEVWAQYGHTAVRVHNHTTGQDVAVNYGMFNMHQSFFVLKFVLGITDYEMGIMPMDYFLAEYTAEGRGVTEQVLNLPRKDKATILAALEQNAKPENVTYRYNYFYDNCTTRARDLIIQHLSGVFTFPKTGAEKSYREMIHAYNRDYAWTQFGEDLLLGIKADTPHGQQAQQFLPDNLMNDFSGATYNGVPFVKTTNILLPAPALNITPGFPLSPTACAIIMAIIGLLVNIYEIKKKKIIRLYDFCVSLSAGLVGIIFFVMLFSEHPCVSLNGLLLAFNPLPLFFLYPMVKKTHALSLHYMWLIWTLLVIISLAIGTIQHYPMPAIILASLLLINGITHLHITKRQDIKK